MRLTLFAYPWDIQRVGPARFVEEMVSLGVSSVAIATVYHSGEMIAPRWRERGLVVAEPGVAHLPLDHARFREVTPPSGRLAVTQPDLFAQLSQYARGAGIRLISWTIALHQSALADQHPDLVPYTCFGDRIPHALCPAQPRVRRYVIDLVDAMTATGWFDAILLESLSYIPVGHAHPHQLRAIRFDPIIQGLLSLCFCDACINWAKERGIPVESVRTWVSKELHRGWNGPLSIRRADDEGAEAIGVISGHDSLREYVLMRFEVVASLVHDIMELTQSKLPVWLSSPVFARPLWASWIQGIDPGRLGNIVDAYGLQAYYRSPELVARELDHALRFIPPHKLVLMQTVKREHNPNLAELLEKIEIAREAGIEEFALYNYGISSEPHLTWIAEVAGA